MLVTGLQKVELWPPHLLPLLLDQEREDKWGRWQPDLEKHREKGHGARGR
jgi:hypothetical protein